MNRNVLRTDPFNRIIETMTQAVATHVELRPNRDGRDRAYIEGTRVRIQDIVSLSEKQGRTPDAIVEALPHLSLAQVHAALSYYFDHRAEIEQELREDQEFVEELRSRLGANRRLKDSTDSSGAPISS